MPMLRILIKNECQKKYQNKNEHIRVRRWKRSSVLLTWDEEIYTFRMAAAAAAPVWKVKLLEDVWLGVVVRKYIPNTVIQWVLAPNNAPTYDTESDFAFNYSFIFCSVWKQKSGEKTHKSKTCYSIDSSHYNLNVSTVQRTAEFQFRTYAQIVLLHTNRFLHVVFVIVIINMFPIHFYFLTI